MLSVDLHQAGPSAPEFFLVLRRVLSVLLLSTDS